MRETETERFNRVKAVVETVIFSRLRGSNDIGLAADLAWLLEQAQKARELEAKLEERPIIIQTQDYVYSGTNETISLHLLKEMSLLRKKLAFQEIQNKFNYREGSE